MKLKEDIIKWQEEVKKLAEQNKLLFEIVIEQNKQIENMVTVTEEMTKTMLVLINQQMQSF